MKTRTPLAALALAFCPLPARAQVVDEIDAVGCGYGACQEDQGEDKQERPAPGFSPAASSPRPPTARRWQWR